jgi:hypothetical protein
MASSSPLGVTFSRLLLNLWYPCAPRVGFLSTFRDDTAGVVLFFACVDGVVAVFLGDFMAIGVGLFVGDLVATDVKARFGG